MKILVVCLDNLGDLVMSTCLIEPIKKKYPDAKLYYWIKEHFTELLRPDPLIENIFSASPFWTGSPNRRAGGLWKYISTLTEIYRAKFDLCVIINPCYRKALSLLFIKKRIGINQKRSGYFLTDVIDDVNPENSHRRENYKAVLNKLGIEENFPVTRLIKNEGLSGYILRFFSRNGLEGSYVFGFQLRSGNKKKDWGGSNYRILAQMLKEHYKNIKIIIFFGAGEKDEIKNIFSGLDYVIIEDNSIGEMSALMNRISLFFGPDSGPSHIANAFGVPVIEYFSIYPSKIFSPFGRGEKIILEKSVLSELTAEEVFSGVKKMEPFWRDRLS